VANDPHPNELEGDVQAQLDRAASLTADLGREVGAEPAPAGPRDAEFFESTTDSEASLDAQIAQVGAAVESTASELGSATPAEATIAAEESTPAAAPAAPPPPSAPKKPFSLPPRKSPTDAPPSASAGGKASASTDSPAKTVVLPQKSTRPDTPDTFNDHTPDLVAGKVAQQPFPVEDEEADRPVQPAAPEGTFARLAHGTLSALCGVLDVLDRPFASIGYSVRWWLGWVALVVAGLALALLVFAVL
jgi:hypothetical protein